jgi:hypothetical protein
LWFIQKVHVDSLSLTAFLQNLLSTHGEKH